MSVVPNSPKDFSDPQYWRKFFEKRGESAFEWYGDYNQLSQVIERYLKPSDNILQIGCGSSLLADQLYDNGFRNIISIDTDTKVIKRQQNGNAKKRPELVFECKSAAETGLADASINVVLDKGTIDALLPTDFSQENQELVQQIFTEVDRCLVPLGRFIIITLAQQHIIAQIVNYFLPQKRFFVRVQKAESTDNDFVMPVFIVIVTKLKLVLPQLPNLEFLRGPSVKVEKAKDANELGKLIESEQRINWFKHYVSRNVVEEATLQICDDDGNPRYQLTIIDDLEAKMLPTCACFIIPLGREADWIFSTQKGRTILRKECEKSRLIVVGLFRTQTYESLESIQSELNGLISSLKPVDCTEKMISFLSLNAMDTKNTLAAGRSEISGEWNVEEVQREQKTYRRLLFLSCAGITQSEVEVFEAKRRRKVIKSDHLACDHHRSMLVALSFLGPGTSTADGMFSAADAASLQANLTVLGLGGGLFPRFLYEKLPRCSITCVEIDPCVVTIAEKYFGFPKPNDRLRVVVDDALNYLRETSQKPLDDKVDVLFVDLAGPIQQDGLSCPPSAFVTEDSLSLMKSCLTPEKGVLAFNLVTRDNETSAKVKERIRGVFGQVYSITSDEDVNEILICPLSTNVSIIVTNGVKSSGNRASGKGKDEWLNEYVDELKKLCICC